MSSVPRRILAAAAFALVALFALAAAEEAFLHTDDGCRVETHCIACRWAYGSASTGAASLGLPIGLTIREAPPADQGSRPAPAPVPAAESRGPPLSA